MVSTPVLVAVMGAVALVLVCLAVGLAYAHHRYSSSEDGGGGPGPVGGGGPGPGGGPGQNMPPAGTNMRPTATIAGKAYSGVECDKLFDSGGDGAFKKEVASNPDACLLAWRATLDDPGNWKDVHGMWGPVSTLRSNANMENFNENLQSTDEWRQAVAKGFGTQILGDQGLPAASDKSRFWSAGYTFHLIRNRWADKKRLGENGISLTWGG